MGADAKRPPLVIFVLEIGDPREIESWAGRGHLPTIGSLMRKGCFGTLTGPEHVCEPGTGLTLLSGRSRGEHGVYAFRQLEPGTYDLRNPAAADARIPPFWTHLHGSGKRVAVIDAPDFHPAPGVPGFHLAHWDVSYAPQAPLTACSEPREILADVRRRFDPPKHIREYGSHFTFEQDLRDYRLALECIAKKGEVCRHLLARGEFDVIVVGFFNHHSIGHRLWKHRRDDATGGDSNEDSPLGTAFRDLHTAIDRELGTLIAGLATEANVFVATLFGLIGQYPTQGLVESFCHRLGYQVAGDPHAAPSSPVSLARRALPERWRRGLSRYFPPRIQERLISDRFARGTDWERTTAFSIPSNYTSIVRVNLAGREPKGIVAPGREYEQLLDRLEKDLRALVDPKTGECAIAEITRTIDAYDGGPPPALPDLFIEWRRTRYFMDRILHPRAELTQPEPHYLRDSYHSFQGFVTAAGPSIRGRGDLGNLSLLDLAPTFLSLLGESAPDMVGRPIVDFAGS